MDIADLERKLGIDGISAEQQMEIITALQQSAAEKIAKAKSESIGKGAELVIQGLKKIKSDMEQKFAQLNGEIQSKVASVQDGQDGKNGKDGRDGKQGPAGSRGPAGRDGVPGRDGVDGNNGTGVASARIDFDGSLVIVLDNGREINVGEVVPFDVAERIKVITNGGGTSQSVLDTLSSLQAQITAMAGFVNYEGTWNASTNTPTLVSSVGTKGDYYVVSTTGTTNLNGVTAWTQGDWAIFNGSAWEKVDNTDLVTSVAGRTGAITLSNTDISGLGTMSTQNASSVAITGGTATLTSLTTATVQATNSGGLSLKNSAGTTQLSMGGGGGDNLSLNVSTNINGTNAQIDISPTGTGHVHIKPTGVNSIEIAPTFVGEMDNMTIGATTPKNGSFVDLSVTGTTSFDGSQGTAGQVLTSAGTGATPTWTTPTTGTVTSVTGTSPVASSGGATPAISLSAGYGDTLNPYASKTANYVLAAPNGSSGAPTFRAIVAADIPTLNQNTTGTAASTPKLLTTNFTIEESGGKLLFKYGATTIASMSSTGVITSATDIVANGTP
jgi:hypothetical protein